MFDNTMSQLAISLTDAVIAICSDGDILYGIPYYSTILPTHRHSTCPPMFVDKGLGTLTLANCRKIANLNNTCYCGYVDIMLNDLYTKGYLSEVYKLSARERVKILDTVEYMTVTNVVKIVKCSNRAAHNLKYINTGDIPIGQHEIMACGIPDYTE